MGAKARRLRLNQQAAARIAVTLAHRQKQNRQAETRTKIQLGGGLIRTGIVEAFGINLGDELNTPAMSARVEWLESCLHTLRDKAERLEDMDSYFQKGDEILTVETTARSGPITPRSPDRKKRTRTLIELGGIVWKSGLPELVGIVMGADLQNDKRQYRPVAILFGLLDDLSASIPASTDYH